MRISDWSSDVCSSDLALHQQDRADGEEDVLAEEEADIVGGGGEGLDLFALVFGERVVPCLGGGFRHRGDERADGLRMPRDRGEADRRSEEHTSELQSLMRISYADFCLKKTTRPTSQSTREQLSINSTQNRT